uniref:Putative ovule protein n=1 Tax=Solanum chacoense TaxID=4108 RepID=A0A0V0HEG2_SOLCH
MTRCEYAIDSRSNLCVICGDFLKKRPWKEFQKQCLRITRSYLACILLRDKKKKTFQSLLLFNIFRTRITIRYIKMNLVSHVQVLPLIQMFVPGLSSPSDCNFSLEMIFIVGC